MFPSLGSNWNKAEFVRVGFVESKQEKDYMICFYHHETQAVGVCKNCGRGICEKCAAEVEDSIACLNHCEKKAGEINNLVNKNIERSEKYESLGAGANYRLATWIFLMGVLFLIFGFYKENMFLQSFGVLCFLGAGVHVYNGFKYKITK